MREEVVYGVCLPVTGFSALFVLFSLMTVVSVIVAGFVCYHRQLAKVSEESAPEPGARVLQVPVQPQHGDGQQRVGHQHLVPEQAARTARVVLNPSAEAVPPVSRNRNLTELRKFN